VKTEGETERDAKKTDARESTKRATEADGTRGLSETPHLRHKRSSANNQPPRA
jgi:hypothetical protein